MGDTLLEGAMSSKDALKMVTSECRDLIEMLIEKDIIPTAPGSKPFTEVDRNKFVRDHLMTNDYGIPVTEYLAGNLSEVDARSIIDEVLSQQEYNQDGNAAFPYGEPTDE